MVQVRIAAIREKSKGRLRIASADCLVPATGFGASAGCGHFGRDKTLALARLGPSLPAAVEKYVRSGGHGHGKRASASRVNHLPPAGLMFPLPVLTQSRMCWPRLARAALRPLRPRLSLIQV